ncbi:MAG TPA: hypothetical protein VFO69_11325 [Allosphingosinicella sp.]|nr:hypothetical protein [Allosphingosinicella sp.]
MSRLALAFLALGFAAGCSGGQEEGVLTEDERQRLENIAERLDKEAAFPAPAGSDATNEMEAAPAVNGLN